MGTEINFPVFDAKAESAKQQHKILEPEVAEVAGKGKQVESQVGSRVKTLDEFTQELVMRQAASRVTFNKNEEEKRKLVKDPQLKKQLRYLDKHGISPTDAGLIVGMDIFDGLGGEFKRNVELLQQAVGMPKSQQDGILGPQTIVACYNSIVNEGSSSPLGENWQQNGDQIDAIRRVYLQLQSNQEGEKNS